ncbi:MAG: hypothetical protein H7338_21575 [Candidatus Sericytochromatia bacterium]|nr:hypothetical protein [Candidatus Sericytochromatia bacterium]
MAIDSLRVAGTAVTPLRTLQRPAPGSPEPAPGVRPLTLKDKFIGGIGPGALAGTKSAMMMAAPLAVMAIDAKSQFIPKSLKAAMPFGSSAGAIVGMTLLLAGTGALVGGVTAMTTKDSTWAPAMGGLAGGVVLGGLRGLQTKSWQGAVAGLLIGGMTGYLAGNAVAKSG